MRFIDLFAGLGGFHLALRNLHHECVFASEIDKELREVYQRNFGIKCEGDIRDIDLDQIPAHDILCAGFPCQPFSKARNYSAGARGELSDLYLQILRVVKKHRPKYLLLENVPNLEKHADGRTWELIKSLLEAEEYAVGFQRLSPHEFGIPQIRDRIYIVGSRYGLGDFSWPKKTPGDVRIDAVLDSSPADARLLPEQVTNCLDVWQEFLDLMPRDLKIPHPLWTMEFGANYPFEDQTPWALSESLHEYRGSFGVSLSQYAAAGKAMFQALPSHARREEPIFPNWKKAFIRKNRMFYLSQKTWLDKWLPQISVFPSSFQKLEWNCQEKDPRDEVRNIREYVLQVRPSGIRVKRRTTAPSLVAMTSTQVPIIAWENRYMTPAECKRLQSMQDIELPKPATRAFAALGNAINVQVAELVAMALIGAASSSDDAANQFMGAGVSHSGQTRVFAV